MNSSSEPIGLPILGGSGVVVHSNIDAAMAKVVESMDLTIQPIIKEDDGPAQVQQLIRCTDADRDRWKQAAAVNNMTISAWIRQCLNKEAKLLLECGHPREKLLVYPWATICTKCNTRL